MSTRFHIYADESGTHNESSWLIIGMLFVPSHGPLHAELCSIKDQHKYFNASPKRKAKYKETHLADFKSPRDLAVAKDWIDAFVKNACYYRCVVIDWDLWNGKYFGDTFEPEALKKRRAYKKWAEMLLHPELRNPLGGSPIYHARFFLDRLRVMYGYDVLGHLRERFTRNYEGESPYIEEYQAADSWKDALQCLQLCDLLTGCVYQALTPSRAAEEKTRARDYLIGSLQPFKVRDLSPQFWRGYDQSTLTKHFPKFSAWFWRPAKKW